MGFDYWLVHLTWTIPPALLVTVAYWPFFTRVEFLKITTLITIAVLFTIPWDSFLVRNSIWTYPADAVVGLTIWSIPIEEVFFFVIQTYSTGLLYVVLTKHLVLPTFLLQRQRTISQKFGTLILSCAFGIGAMCIQAGLSSTYLGLILVWAIPVIMFQWFLCSSFLLELPGKTLISSILLPTVYLWVVDSVALHRGTWVIGNGTKLNIQIWGPLDIEEATFFLITNIMIVFGLVTIDHAIAIAEYDNAVSMATERHMPSFRRVAVFYLLDRPKTFDLTFLEGLSSAVDRLARKSQSMFLGSAMFQGQLRIDLILLYSFCRVIDDLVDEDRDPESARLTIRQAAQALKDEFATQNPENELTSDMNSDEKQRFKELPPPSLLASVRLLPVSRFSLDPLLELLAGFKSDLLFSAKSGNFPIASESDLELYAYRVASTVASCLLELVFSHYEDPDTNKADQDHHKRTKIIEAGQRMGQALQYVNIARDIRRDAAIGRVYIPSTWLKEQDLAPHDVLVRPDDPRIGILEERMLLKARKSYDSSINAIDELPREARGPVRTVVESYMAIGQALCMKRGTTVRGNGKLKLPLWQRLALAWRVMGGYC